MLLAAAVLVPFLDKAFTVDDTVFLRQAEHAVEDPLHPTAFDMVWGEVPARVSPTSGIVMAWLLVPAILAGGSERVAHLTQLVMLALALLATVSLGIRLGLAPRSAAAAGLLLAATPAALGMAGTAMADVPAMSIGVLGLERLVAWRQERRLHQALLAAASLALAPVTRPHLLLLLGVGALLLVGDCLRSESWRKAGWRLWIPLAAAPLLTALLLLVTRDPSPSAAGIVAATSQTSALERVPRNVVAFSIHWVLVLPLALPWIVLRLFPILRRWPVLILSTVAMGALMWLSRELPPLPTPYRFAPIAGLGAAVLFDVLWGGWKRRDATQITLGLWLLVALVAAPYFQVPSKYLLASAPAAALLVAREVAARGGRLAHATLVVTCLVGLALGVAILRADAAFAGLGRTAAAALVGPQVAAGRNVWFAAHWGFQWYAEKAGGRIVTLTPPYPAPGDLLVLSRNTEVGFRVNRMVLSGFRLRGIATIEDNSAGGRIMLDGAGFYDNGRGYLPWTWGDGVLDAFLLTQVQ
jgi:4-amino-4-deoxy-L-arabinose transferase-like glycosyltransferase